MSLPHDRELTPAEFDELLRRALAEEDEMAAQRAHIAWFRKRYPTAKERLQFATRRYREWMRSRPKSV
jgi:hypothetical protein